MMRGSNVTSGGVISNTSISSAQLLWQAPPPPKIPHTPHHPASFRLSHIIMQQKHDPIYSIVSSAASGEYAVISVYDNGSSIRVKVRLYIVTAVLSSARSRRGAGQ